jgi:hypothetical protein
MEDFFIISRVNIDTTWNINDLHDDYNAMEYADQILDIPEEHIEHITFSSEGLEITLTDIDSEDMRYDNDWYLQLRRISNYAIAS